MTIVPPSARRASIATPIAAVFTLALAACTSTPTPATQGASSMPPTKPEATTLDRDLDFITLINTFTVTRENQQPFVEAQHGEYRRLQGQIPGAIAANLHRGRSGTRVVNYAQFRSLEDIRAWQSSELMKQHLPVITPYIERASPGLFRLEHVAARAPEAAKITEGTVAVIAVMSIDPAALDGTLALQRDAADQLVRAVPGTRALAIHRSVGAPRPGADPGEPAAPRTALYAVVEDEATARALMEHAGYRASFTTENTHLRAVDADIYTTVAVE